ncbi:MAG: hypothetical protein KA715_12145 [Xanthomonadaceae bacterium]|nr:hypothetical protein [Xanthomonadaceae bacterium]
MHSLLFILFIATTTFADIRIQALIGPKEMSISCEKDCSTEIHPLNRYAIFSQTDSEFLGYAEITETNKNTAKATLVSRTEDRLIRVNDLISTFDLNTKPQENVVFPGRMHALISGRKNISSRYKHTIFHNTATVTAQTLDQGEWLINVIGDIGYGINNHLTIGTSTLITAVAGVPNISAKQMITDNEFFTLTAGSTYYYIPSIQTHAGAAAAYLRLNGLGRFVSHYSFIFDFISSPQQPIGSFFESRFQSSYEVILDNWNRLLFGPTYILDNKAIGGYFGYLWVGDRFHFGVGLRSSNLLNFSFSPLGYQPEVQLYVRF